jgi:hypothetical protein
MEKKEEAEAGNLDIKNLENYGHRHGHGRPQTFFDGGGVSRTYFLPKTTKKTRLFFSKKSKNIKNTIFGKPGVGKSTPQNAHGPRLCNGNID